MTTDISDPIYLDCHATTPLDPRVLEAMLPYFTRIFGNPASVTHAYGWRASDAVEQARGEVAAIAGATPKEIVFTSGATEALNLAVKGVVRASTRATRHIVTSAIEHKALLDSCAALEREGTDVTVLDPAPDGRVRPADVARALRPDTVLCAIGMVNNEIGTINPIGEIGRITRAQQVLLLCDAAQGVGRLPIDVNAMGIDLLAISAHKFYGPKGVGALYVRHTPRIPLAPLCHGGGQEHARRPGTLNVPAIVGMGAAAALARAELVAETTRISGLRDALCRRLASALDMEVNGSLAHRVAGNLNVSFAGVDGEALLEAICPRVAVSSGAACAAAAGHGSHVLRALGLPSQRALASLRFGLGRFTTEDEVDRAARVVIEVVTSLRARSRPSAPARGRPSGQARPAVAAGGRVKERVEVAATRSRDARPASAPILH